MKARFFHAVYGEPKLIFPYKLCCLIRASFAVLSPGFTFFWIGS